MIYLEEYTETGQYGNYWDLKQKREVYLKIFLNKIGDKIPFVIIEAINRYFSIMVEYWYNPEIRRNQYTIICFLEE